MSVKLLLDEIIIWICQLSKVGCRPQCGWATSNPLKPWIEQKLDEGKIHPFYSCLTIWARTSHLTFSALGLGFTPSPPLVLQPLDSDWVTLQKFSWVSSLQRADCRTSHPPYEQCLNNKSISLLFPPCPVSVFLFLCFSPFFSLSLLYNSLFLSFITGLF